MSLARFLPRFRRAQQRIADIAAREKFSREDMTGWQILDQLNWLWQSSSSVPYYQRLFEQTKGLPSGFDTLEEFSATVPILEKQTIREQAKAFRSPLAKRGAWHRSSGSTGVPMRFFRSNETHAEMLCYQYRFRQMWGINIFHPAAFFGAGVARSERGFSGLLRRAKQGLTDSLRNRVRLPVHQLSSGDLARQLDRIAKYRPAYIYGYSQAIHLLAKEALARGFTCPSLKVVMMTSEPALPHMVATVERAFGVPAVIEYGSVECGVIAYEWPDRKLRVRSDRVIVETPRRDDGRYDIIVTVLDNPDFPLLRYRIGDVTDTPLQELDHPFPVLTNIAGRQDDVLIAGNGSPVHPAEIDGIFEGDAKPAVRRYKLHQTANGDIRVQVEPAGPAPIDVAAIERAVARAVPGRPVYVEVVQVIQQTEAGKHRPITSDLRIT